MSISSLETPVFIKPSTQNSDTSNPDGALPPDLTLRAIREVFDRSPLGIIEVDALLNVVYANRVALETVGAEHRDSLSLLELLDGENRKQLEMHFSKRMEGQAGEYELVFRHLQTGQDVPVRIAAVPIRNSMGIVLGSFGFFHNTSFEQALRAFDLAIANARSREEILRAIATELNKVVPYDLCTVSVYNDETTRSRIVFQYPEDQAKWPIRWFQHNAKLATWAAQTDVLVVNDLAEFLKNHDFVREQEEPRVKYSINPAEASFVRRPVVIADRVVASLSIFRNRRNAFTQSDRDVLEHLPIDKAVVIASYFEKIDDLNFREALLSDLLKSDNLQLFDDRIAQLIVNRIAQHYDWDHVSIFRAEPLRNVFVLAAQSARGVISFPENYSQPMTEGFLGWVVTQNQDAVSQDVCHDPKFKDVYLQISPNTRSELCMRIMHGGRIAGLLNIEDSRQNAFSDEEKHALDQLVRGVAGILERRRVQNLITATFQSTPSAVLAVYLDGTIGQVNPATTELLGYSEEELTGKMLQELFLDSALSDMVVHSKAPTSTDAVLVRKDGSHVKVMLGGSRLADQSGVVVSCRDLTARRREEHLELLKEIFFEIASQTKPPLALAFEWLRQVREQLLHSKDGGGKQAELIDKTVRQLRKVQLTYDRLTVYEGRSKPCRDNVILLNAHDLLNDVLSEFPQGEAEQVKIDWQASQQFLKVDPSQISFALETTLSYLLRFLPQKEILTIHTENRTLESHRSLFVTIDAPATLQSEPTQRKADLYLAKVKSDISFGVERVAQLVEENGGVFRHFDKHGDERRFEFEFPVIEEAAA